MHVETVCLLSKLNETHQHIEVTVDMDEMDVTAAESKATYDEIRNWVQENYGFHVTNLNIALQEAINPVGDSLSRGGFKYRRGDRVMQIRNNYDKDVFNGDIGTVEYVDTEERTLTVSFDGHSIEYEDSELDELTLAYATTIHKSQGSEYPVVVMPLLMTHFVMLQRNLVYTGITRAKKLCIIVGTTKALAYAIHNMVVLKRNTRLKERLTDKSNKQYE